MEHTVLSVCVLAAQQLVQVDEAGDSSDVFLPVDFWVSRVLDGGEAGLGVGDPLVDSVVEALEGCPSLAVVVVAPEAEKLSIRVPRGDAWNVEEWCAVRPGRSEDERHPVRVGEPAGDQRRTGRPGPGDFIDALEAVRFELCDETTKALRFDRAPVERVIGHRKTSLECRRSRDSPQQRRR